MKLLKVKIGREQSGNGTHYTYPMGYNARQVKFGPFYESSLPENYQAVVDRGNVYEFCVIGVTDENVPSFLRSKDIVELTKKEALALGNVWTKQIEKISDPNKVMSICAKQARGETLTQKEKDCLDPDKAEIGVNKSKSFEDSLNEFITE